eukprot:gene3606-4045_t
MWLLLGALLAARYAIPCLALPHIEGEVGARPLKEVRIQNPIPLYTEDGQRLPAQMMNAHDGTIRQWTRGGPYYYYAMAYHVGCAFKSCGDPTCGHLTDHQVLVWSSPDLTNRSWTLAGDALPVDRRPQGPYFRPHVTFNPPTGLWVLLINARISTLSPLYQNYAATSTTPAGPFTGLSRMAGLKYASQNLGDFGLYTEGPEAYLAYNVMGRGHGIVVEHLDGNFTDGQGPQASTSECLICRFSANDSSIQWQESPSMFKVDAGSGTQYAVLTAGATCFGVPQPGGGRWGGVGVFVYISQSPLGPFNYAGDVNSIPGPTSDKCGECMGNPCPGGRCSVPIQLNSILQRHDGSPLALSVLPHMILLTLGSAPVIIT